ncbi:MAG: signal recognition particle-docking protein FtsY [Cohaesibacter sp.]|nr:signal recognition particle-docking protein FtsY [Cohaesibacter sp.]
MSKKPGLFSRLFGSGKEAAEPASSDAAQTESEQNEIVLQDDVPDDVPDDMIEERSDHDEGDQVVEGEPLEDRDDLLEEMAETTEEADLSDPVSDGSEDESFEPVEEGDEPVSPDKEAALEPVSGEPEKKLSWFERLKRGLARSSGALGEGIASIFTKRKLDDDILQDLEDILIQADLGVETAMTITERLADGRYNKEVSGEEVQNILADEVNAVLEPVATPLKVGKREDGSPHVILMIGVNGAGKTTTIGKLAQKFRSNGQSVMLAAGDTFRAAAIDQLKVWGERTGCPVVARDVGSDAAGLAFDAMSEAKEQGCDLLMIDTAGRLQNRTELMDELEKIVRVIKKHDESAPHSVLLVLDATTGQNALNQVEIFSKIAGVTGLVMTKLDGTARGGILVAISAKHQLPVHFIGVGEGVDDLEPFQSQDFARAIAGLAN